MCDAGKVLVNGHEAKPSKELKTGDRIALQFTLKSLELEVLALPGPKSAQKSAVQNLYCVISEKRSSSEARGWIKDLS